MFRYLLVLFIVVPFVELFILIRIADLISFWPTVGLVIVTGAAGASLARWQGTRVIAEIRKQLDEMRIPGDALIDGLLILIAGALLITPGIITDAVGFLLLIPFARAPLRRFLKSRIKLVIEERAGTMAGMGQSGPEVIDYDPRSDPDNPRYRQQ